MLLLTGRSIFSKMGFLNYSCPVKGGCSGLCGSDYECAECVSISPDPDAVNFYESPCLYNNSGAVTVFNMYSCQPNGQCSDDSSIILDYSVGDDYVKYFYPTAGTLCAESESREQTCYYQDTNDGIDYQFCTDAWGYKGNKPLLDELCPAYGTIRSSDNIYIVNRVCDGSDDITLDVIEWDKEDIFNGTDLICYSSDSCDDLCDSRQGCQNSGHILINNTNDLWSDSVWHTGPSKAVDESTIFGVDTNVDMLFTAKCGDGWAVDEDHFVYYESQKCSCITDSITNCFIDGVCADTDGECFYDVMIDNITTGYLYKTEQPPDTDIFVFPYSCSLSLVACYLNRITYLRSFSKK